jgi:hypothetical protein
MNWNKLKDGIRRMIAPRWLAGAEMRQTNSGLPVIHKPQKKTCGVQPSRGALENMRRGSAETRLHKMLPYTTQPEIISGPHKCWVFSGGRSLLTSHPKMFDSSPILQTRWLWMVIYFLSPWGGQRGSGLVVGGQWVWVLKNHIHDWLPEIMYEVWV